VVVAMLGFIFMENVFNAIKNSFLVFTKQMTRKKKKEKKKK
jgi:hypothetical protein